MLSPKQRFWKTIHFEPVAQLPLWADWLGPFERWKSEGLRCDAIGSLQPGSRDWFVRYFGFEGMYSAFWGTHRVPANIGVCPSFEHLVYEETDAYRIYRSGNGSTVKQFKDSKGSLHSTQFLAYPIKTRADWAAFRDNHLDPDAPERYPLDAAWRRLVEDWRQRDHVISIDGGSFYGFLRDWVGVENISLMLYDDPELIREMTDYLADFYIRVLSRAVQDLSIDFAMFWEDMCYKTGPLISPAMFRRFFLPAYKKVTNFLEQNGVKLSWVDCDGNIEELIPLWIEGGVRGFYPLEVAAGMDAGKLREQYGQDIVMWGNVDKRALTRGPAAIDGEIERLRAVSKSGGFIPLVDHGVPDDVPLEHYIYYLERRKHILG
jgi:hypothetical protein